MKILVTGGAGFIGSHVIDKLLLNGIKVICIDNFNNYYSTKIKEINIAKYQTNNNFLLFRGDIVNRKFLKEIFRKEKIDRVIHLAAKAGVRASIKDPFSYYETNVVGTLNLLELAREYEIENFVLTSSSSVYGNNAKIPFVENDITEQPISPYGVTKKTTELMAYTFHHLYKLNINVIRPFTVYGPAGRPDMAPFLFTQLIYHDKEIIRYGDGSSKRDYTYIDDFVDGIIASVHTIFGFEIFNLGNSSPIELNYLISVIEKLLNKKAKIKSEKLYASDMKITYSDIRKAKSMLKYNPKTTIEQGMDRFVNWYLKYKDYYNE